jgi:putative oxygen-independent coproporphyrinogen III oxidase
MNTANAGIYISVPFCRQKCTYCNFASDVHPSSLLPEYAKALIKEIGGRRELWPAAGIPVCNDLPVDAIYMGGGTPGLLAPEQLAAILDAVRASFHVGHSAAEDGAEITIEASPENVTAASAAAWAGMGVNRVSLGVQSMVREEIRAVGRIYDAADVTAAFANLRAAGIRNISADLIAGLPHQTAASWERSMEELLALAPEHVSVYMLEVDDDSRLGNELLRKGEHYHATAVPTEEQVADFYCAAMERLRGAGFEHYEISNFARPGKRSRQNQKYWTNAPYFGFGADAHSYDGERRWANVDDAVAYIEKIEHGQLPVVENKTLDWREKLEERLFLGLRRREGVSLVQVEVEFAGEATGNRGQGAVGAKFGVSIRQQYAEPIRKFTEAGWLESEGDTLRLTDRGVLFSNDVFAGFLEDK